MGLNYQATPLPKAGAHADVERGDVRVTCSTVDVFVEEAIAADAWRRRMHERYKQGHRDAGHAEEDALHARYDTRPQTGACGAADLCDGERMEAELAALHAWRTAAFAAAF